MLRNWLRALTEWISNLPRMVNASVVHRASLVADDRWGLVANARNAWPDADEFGALSPRWMRTIVYDFESFDAALALVPEGTGIIAMINSETEGVGDDYSGWSDTIWRFAQRFAGRVHAVECINEWDLLEIPAETAAECARQAAPILAEAGITCLLGSVAGPNWAAELALAIALLSEEERTALGGVCFHPYGQRAAGFPADWGFGEIDAAVRTARDISGLPVWLTEFGIKIDDAGGDNGQARYLRRAFITLSRLDRSILGVACFFCWHDAVGAPHEQGGQAFGLRRLDHSQRPAWSTFADLLRR